MDVIRHQYNGPGKTQWQMHCIAAVLAQGKTACFVFKRKAGDTLHTERFYRNWIRQVLRENVTRDEFTLAVFMCGLKVVGVD